MAINEGYDFRQTEKKWQKIWEENKTFQAKDQDDREKFYGLIEFPYPSGVGLHVGHIRAFTSIEIISRMKRMQGYNVLFPIGWDAFGLPTENFAIKTGRNPREVTDENIKTFTQQLQAMGYSFDWDRTVDTTDPDYYKWTQWIFLKLFENGLAYKDTCYVNFCENCKVVLANEESQGGVCDRCGSEVVQMEKNVWFLRIKQYSEKLLEGLNEVDFLPRIKVEQQNWIGKSTGAEVTFKIAGEEDTLVIYTTRPDTLYGATFMVIAPEHPIIDKYADKIKNIDEIYAYREEAKKKNEFERVQLVKDKTGVRIDGLRAVNPVNGSELPIFVADYVMMGYGTGAIMAVPAHDTRDYEFAKKFDLPIIEVVSGGDISEEAYTDCNDGIMVNSGILDGLTVPQAKEKIIAYLTEQGVGHQQTNYNMKDWAFNRQRYWGEPIPIIECPHCGLVGVPEEELPLRLPEVKNYKPTATGESPLSEIEEFVNCKCPKCGAPAKRETDTMPQWAGSSWYFLRYMDPHNSEALASPEALKYWGPVDWYNGGMEHVTRHLIYSRFWNKVLYELGIVPFSEPYKKRTYQGLILGEDGEKMSKSRGNVVNPTDYVDKYGADVFRTYMMFLGDYEKAVPWSSNSIIGVKRFLDKIWELQSVCTDDPGYSPAHTELMHETIKKVTEDILAMKFNTAVAAMMKAVNTIVSDKTVTKGELSDLVVLLAPYAPHICEEIWQNLGHEGILSSSNVWPTYDPAVLENRSVEIPVQVNGKLKGVIRAAKDADVEALKAQLKADERFAAFDFDAAVKTIYVPGKILNFIIR
ncbi:MAG: leucine--tRNA ligase [Oscillospiraceae bacterium]|nr:leucine--tRNA ligase [Oscillospiraceae bacterium]